MRASRNLSRAVLPAIVLSLFLLVSGVYWQVGEHPFINLDDNMYVSGNPVVLRGLTLEGASWAFTTLHAGNWHPLTWLSHMLDVELFGAEPGWHHRMNMLYHLLGTELLFLVLWRMTGGVWQSAFVAALFGIHPLHVESVAWVAERKDVLSTLFWILTMGAYLRYARRPGTGRYLLTVVPFALGLMCKPMLVTLPFALLLLDWWPLGRAATADPPVPPRWGHRVRGLPRLVLEKVPLLVLSAVSCAITFHAQSGFGAVSPLEHIPFGSRISNALVSYVAYLGKAAWPASLSVYYPHPALSDSGIPAWKVAGAVALLCGLTILAIRHMDRRPYLGVGWLWYLGTLVPVIGVVQVGEQAMADRYTYVPLIGIFLAAAWGFTEALAGWRLRKPALAGIGGGLILAMGVTAWHQAGYWRDSTTLFTRSLEVTGKNWAIWNNLGISYARLGQLPQAINCYREALRQKSDFAEAWYNLGVGCDKLGEVRQAIGYYREALRIRPKYAEAWYNLGVAHGKLGQNLEAIGYYREALRIRPDFTEAWINLGVEHGKLGKSLEAIGYYREALRIRPDSAEAWYNSGLAHEELGQIPQAIGYFREALRIRPDYAEAWNNLGVACEKLGQARQAIGYYREALRIRPDYALARENLVRTSGKPDAAR